MTSRAYLTFVSIDTEGRRVPIPPLLIETADEQERAAAAEIRRQERLEARRELEGRTV
jgi:acyl-CoA hydrolase